MLDPEIALQLSRAGGDVESIQRDQQVLRGADDDVVLEAARRLGRTLVTDNVRHFVALHNQVLSDQSTHAGILLAHPRTLPRSKRSIGRWVTALTAALERHRDTSTENLCEWLLLSS